MVQFSIKKLVVLPLFIATLLTSFYIMQPKGVDAIPDIEYKDSGDDDGTPLASDRFNKIEQRKAFATHSQTVTPYNSPLSDKIELELQQFIDCVTGTAPKGTCSTTQMKGTQAVTLTQGSNDFVDVEADLFMLQKDDSLGQDRINNKNEGTQTVTATTTGTGSATIDISHNGDENELNMNMYQYNKRNAIDSDDRSTYSIDVEDAVADESSGGGNDDSNNKNIATQRYTATADGNSAIRAASTGDQDFTVAQFNAECDDTDPSSLSAPIDITCYNDAEQKITLASEGSAKINFETLSEIETQQLNTCGFSKNLECFNDGDLKVNVVAAGAGGEANVELENPNGNPVLFQENSCSNLPTTSSSNSLQECDNVSNNIFDVNKQGMANIEKTNLDLEVRQVNDCDDATTAPIDCKNGGLLSGVTNLNTQNMQDFGEANTLVTVDARGGAVIEDADPDSFLTMINDCDGAKRQSSNVIGTSSCTNNALNEAHFDARTGSNIDVDRVVQNSETINNCDSLDTDTCLNTAKNTFVAATSNDATININEDVYQTNDLENRCNDAECNNDAVNAILLVAADGATITASNSDLKQTSTLYNGCYQEADCDNVAQNIFSVTADPATTGGDVNILDLTQQIKLSNTCYGSTTECSLDGTNIYSVTNTGTGTLTISPYQSIDLSCSGNTDCNKDQTNYFAYTKTSGTDLTFYSTQTSSTGASDNNYNNPAVPSSTDTTQYSGCRTLTQPGQSTPSQCT